MKRQPRASFNESFLAGRSVITAQTPGEINRPHGMDAWIINLTTEGRGRIGRGEERFNADPGDLLLFKPDAPHDYWYDPQTQHWTHLWAYFFPRREWYDWLAWPPVSPGILRLRPSPPILATVRRLFDDVIDAWRGPLSRREALAMALLEQLLLWCDAANPGSAEGRLDPRMQSALAWMRSHHAQPMRLEQAAEVAGMSLSRFAHRFRAEVGTTPLKWLEQYRITLAREQLLATSLHVADIGAQVGYPNPVYFARVFRRLVGRSPRAFRRSAG
ncbi:MAG: arabinose operon transcriptional regulator AraC [Planctomycetes bacterium]|nr:arabinose operon transcriptional regulator AraC [Planctomycetota bacterium]